MILKTINMTFSPEAFEKLVESKAKMSRKFAKKQTWEEFILKLSERRF